MIERAPRTVAVDHRVTDDDLAWLSAQLAVVDATAQRADLPVDTLWITVEAIR
jgi:hypothetical protein